MRKNRQPRRGEKQQVEKNSLEIAEKTLALIATREGKTVEMVKKHIKLAMMSGLLSTDPAVQAEWKRIPCAGEVPTPEEVIAFYASELTKA